MRNARRLTMMGLLFCGVLVLAANSWAQTAPANSRTDCQNLRYRFVGQIEAIRYTWNGEITGLFKAAHKWEWEPKTGKITYEGTDKDGKPVKVSYDVRSSAVNPTR